MGGRRLNEVQKRSFSHGNRLLLSETIEYKLCVGRHRVLLPTSSCAYNTICPMEKLGEFVLINE